MTEINYRDRLVRFKYPQLSDLRIFLWNPRFPPFDPVFTFKEICIPLCPNFTYLKNIKGYTPSLNNVYKIPRTQYNYINYYNDRNNYHNAVLNILNNISWNNDSQYLIDEPIESARWGNLINLLADSSLVRDQLRNYFTRIQEEGRLRRYHEKYGEILFRIQLFNPEITLPAERNNDYVLRLRQTEFIPRPYRFTWTGSFPAFGMIDELNFENREIVGYMYYNRQFFSEGVRAHENFEEYESEMIMIPAMHQLWLIRLALSTLNNNLLQNFTLNLVDAEVFRSQWDDLPRNIDFSNYNLRLETPDQSYSYNTIIGRDVDLPLRTAQSLIFLKVVHGRRPTQILNTNFQCLADDDRFNHCGLAVVCNMRDYVRFPPEIVSENVLTFQKYLRDEITLKSSDWFYLFKLINRDILELRNHIDLWIGTIRVADDTYTYNNNNNLFPDRPPLDQQLRCILWSPFFYISNFAVILEEQESEIIIHEYFQNNRLNSMTIEKIFNEYSIDGELPVILGDFPREEFYRIYRRQQKAIWRASNFRLSRNPDETIEDFDFRVLERRLNENDRRAGEGIFGNRVRFIPERRR